MKVLIGCECSGVVRDAFLAEGHDAWSCDLKPALRPTNRHIVGDVRDVMKQEDWDLLFVAHPPCVRLCNSGVRWLHKPPTNPPSSCSPEEALLWPILGEESRLKMMWKHLDEGAALFSDVWNADIPHVAVENPVVHRYAKERIRNYEPFAQSVQPWQFGDEDDGPDNEKKRTCLWIRNMPILEPTGTLDGSTARNSVHSASPGPKRSEERSIFFPGIAKAMAQQWGDFVNRKSLCTG